ncbi:MAG: ABC transporter ATP-binding protein/permease [Lachnospiraceae bacterium]|nr:ABC transporter ATP-binding protein/permease [Lachnospiraceae bacterium]
MKDLNTIRQMFSHLFVILNKKQRIKMFGMMIIILIGSLFELLGVAVMLPFMEALLTPEDLMEKKYIRFFMDLFHIYQPHMVLIMVGVGIVLIYLVKNLYLALSSLLQIRYSWNTRRELAVLMLRSFMNRPYSFFVDNGSGVIMRGVTNDTEGVYLVLSNLFKFASEGFVIASVAIYLFLVDPFLAGGVLGIGFLCMLVIVFGVRKMLTKMAKRYRSGFAQLNKWLVQINTGIKDIMAYNRRDIFLSRYDEAYEKTNSAITRSDFASIIPERIIETSCISGIIILVLLRISSGANAAEFVPKMSVFAMGAFRLLPSISRVTGYISIFIFNRASVEAAYENIVQARTDLAKLEKETASEIDDGTLKFNDRIEIRDLVWKYSEGKSNVLDGFDLTIHKGEAIGIIGESGSGKSTFADLMLRLYKPLKGTICMDGTDINTIPKTWTKVLAYVPQTVFMLDDTIRGNVAFGDETGNDDLIWDALKRASLADFIRSLPEGLDTIVGERGVKFSGGQRQRLAIARALYNDPQILILDEATSALDNETEEAVMEAIDSLSGSVTLIIIAHRVTTLKNCDKIYEISAGKAKERNKKDVL